MNIVMKRTVITLFITFLTAYTAHSEIVVWSNKSSDSAAVFYAGAYNTVCNLYISEGLPASPFSIDNWPCITAGKLKP